jgi:hypothetical protein
MQNFIEIGQRIASPYQGELAILPTVFVSSLARTNNKYQVLETTADGNQLMQFGPQLCLLIIAIIVSLWRESPKPQVLDGNRLFHRKYMPIYLSTDQLSKRIRYQNVSLDKKRIMQE